MERYHFSVEKIDEYLLNNQVKIWNWIPDSIEIDGQAYFAESCMLNWPFYIQSHFPSKRAWVGEPDPEGKIQKFIVLYKDPVELPTPPVLRSITNMMAAVKKIVGENSEIGKQLPSEDWIEELTKFDFSKQNPFYRQLKLISEIVQFDVELYANIKLLNFIGAMKETPSDLNLTYKEYMVGFLDEIEILFKAGKIFIFSDEQTPIVGNKDSQNFEVLRIVNPLTQASQEFGEKHKEVIRDFFTHSMIAQIP